MIKGVAFDFDCTLYERESIWENLTIGFIDSFGPYITPSLSEEQVKGILRQGDTEGVIADDDWKGIFDRYCNYGLFSEPPSFPAFMDFIIPEYTMPNFRDALENGRFFSIARYAKNELGEDFVGEGDYPLVKDIKIDDDNGIITVSGENCSAIEWIADGEIIKSDVADCDSSMTSEISLAEFENKISCYVRAQLKGRGGICMTQAFICDDGNMERFIDDDAEIKPLTAKEKRKKAFNDTRLGVIVNKIKQK